MKKVLYTLSIAILGGIIALSMNQFYRTSTVIESAADLTSGQNDYHYQFASLLPKSNVMVDFTYAAKLSTPAVVHIKSYKEVVQNQYQNPFWYLFGETPPPNTEQSIQASGSGVIISGDGYIITNNHVIKGANEISISLDDNRQFDAKIIGTYPPADLALLKVEEEGLPYLKFGNSDELDVGEWILAVGNPFNLTSTVTAGIVSAKARNINIIEEQYAIESFIQTDAAVNPGNSGGALVNLQGELVGINTAILSKTGSYAGYSFAIPISIVEKVYNDLKKYGMVQRGLMGVHILPVTQDLIEKEGLKTVTGVYVKGVVEEAAAEAAGIKEGDIIVQINDSRIQRIAELQEELSKYGPNDKIKVTVNRDGNLKQIDVTLRNEDNNTAIIKKSDLKNEQLFGAYFAAVTDSEKQKLRIGNGVKIIRLEEGAFKNAQIKSGFIITHVEQEPVKSTADLTKLLKRKKASGAGGVLLQGMYPNGKIEYYGIGI